MEKGRTPSPGKPPPGGLPRNSVFRINDRPDMTSAVYRGRKASIQTNKQTNKQNNENSKSNGVFDKVTRIYQKILGLLCFSAVL